MIAGAVKPTAARKPAAGVDGAAVLLRGAASLLKFPLLCAVFCRATAPVYTALRDGFLGTAAAGGEGRGGGGGGNGGGGGAPQHATGVLASWGVQLGPAWPAAEDELFAIGLSLSLTAVWLLSNGFYYCCDTLLLNQQYGRRRAAG